MNEDNVASMCSGLPLGHKRSGIMAFAATWMDLEMFILSEVSQTKTNMISLICDIF